MNRGDSCASAVAGTVQLLTATGQPVRGALRSFSLPAGQIVRPLERFGYRGCCHTTAELDQTTSHTTLFTWTDVTCPQG